MMCTAPTVKQQGTSLCCAVIDNVVIVLTPQVVSRMSAMVCTRLTVHNKVSRLGFC